MPTPVRKSSTITLFVTLAVSLRWAQGHHGAFTKGMYCKGGPNVTPNQNSNNAVNPLYQLPKSEWWMHHVDQCDEYPPPEGEFMEVPAGGNFTVEIATNQAFTTLSYNGTKASDWTDGQTYPEDYHAENGGCITSPNLHTQNQSMAAGTAFAISYTASSPSSDIKQVTPENLVVFTVLEHTPWKRIATYQVPKDMPACPEGGCICVWGWIPNGCGQPNMYMFPYICQVTGATSQKKIAVAKPALWCEDDQSKCVPGAKQMLFWHQLEGDTIEVSGNDLSGQPRSPAYNTKCGFRPGAQEDIFEQSNDNIPPVSDSKPPANSSSTTVQLVLQTVYR